MPVHGGVPVEAAAERGVQLEGGNKLVGGGEGQAVLVRVLLDKGENKNNLSLSSDERNSSI